MGDDIAATTYTREQRQAYRAKVRRCLDVFERMLVEHSFDFGEPMTGLEIELNLVDQRWQPAMANAEVLEVIADPDFQTELGRYNIEFNVRPRSLSGELMLDLEQVLRESLDHAEAKANEIGSEIIMIGILPTLRTEHFETEWMSANPRYKALDEAVFAARREDLELDISGPDHEHLQMFADTIAPESACTSVQLHLQVSPADFAACWNAAQALAGPQTGARRQFAVPVRQASSGRRPVPSCSCRPPTPGRRSCGTRGCGRRCSSANAGSPRSSTCSRRTCGTSRRCCRRPPTRTRRRCWPPAEAPRLQELRLHNGTVYRWNRPVYDVVDGRPHLRVENRVLPAGPTVVDVLANAAFYYGALTVLAAEDRPGVDEDVVRRREGQLRRRALGTAWTPSSTGRASAR